MISLICAELSAGVGGTNGFTGAGGESTLASGDLSLE